MILIDDNTWGQETTDDGDKQWARDDDEQQAGLVMNNRGTGVRNRSFELLDTPHTFFYRQR
jgi:hypothetical protein